MALTITESLDQYRLARYALSLKRFTARELATVAGVSPATAHNFLTPLRHQTPALVIERHVKREGVGRPPVRFELTGDGIQTLSKRNLTLAAELNEEALAQDPSLDPARDRVEAAAGTSRPLAVSPGYAAAFGLLFGEVRKAWEQGASVCYVGAGQPTRMRVERELKPLIGAHVWGMERLDELTADLLTMWQKKRLDLRGSVACTYHTPEATAMVLRVFKERGTVGLEIGRPPTRVPSVQDLKLPTIVESFCGASAGLVIVSGPIGSGRSLALAAMTDHINQIRAGRIITLDEPAMFCYENKKSVISQRQVGLDTPDFWTGAKEALKETLDVLVVGDLSDHRTVETVLDASRRVLVICRVEAPDLPEAIDVLVNLVPPSERGRCRRMLAETLVGGIGLSPEPPGARAPAGPVAILEPDESIRNLVMNPAGASLLRNTGDAATGRLRVSVIGEAR